MNRNYSQMKVFTDRACKIIPVNTRIKPYNSVFIVCGVGKCKSVK